MPSVPIYSGPVNTVSDAAVQAIPPQPGVLIRNGQFWNPQGAPAGAWSLDNISWVDFEVGPFSIVMPGGFYPLGVWFRRVPGGTNLAGAKVVLYPASGAMT